MRFIFLKGVDQTREKDGCSPVLLYHSHESILQSIKISLVLDILNTFMVVKKGLKYIISIEPALVTQLKKSQLNML